MQALPPCKSLSRLTSTLPGLLQTHALLLTTGALSNPSTLAKLIFLYSSHRLPHISSLLFHSSPTPPDTFLWNSVIQSHFSNSNFALSLRFFLFMHSSHRPANHFTLPMVVSACAELRDLGMGKCVHGIGVRSGFWMDSCFGSALVYMYAKCGVLGCAGKVFEEMPVRDVVSWTALVGGFVANGEFELGLERFREMLGGGGGGVRPNSRTVSAAIKASGGLEAVRECRCLHGFAVRIGVLGCRYVRMGLLSVYAKFGSLQEVETAFDEVGEKDVVCWTAIDGWYARKGFVRKCLELFEVMLASGVQPDGVFVGCMLMAFASAGCVRGGKAYHALILRREFEFDSVVVHSLLSMYCKFELIDYAKIVFHKMGKENVECWNMMVVEFEKMELGFDCLDLFRRMQYCGFTFVPDIQCLQAVISSCSKIAPPNLGRSVHCYTIKSQVIEGTSILNSLVSMYGRCGRLDVARRIFNGMGMDRDLITWNNMITVYAHGKNHDDALAVFDEMLLRNVKPNPTTLKIVLSVCSSLTDLNRGKCLHKYIEDEGLLGDLTLQTTLVDLYAKCGKLSKARDIFNSIQDKDVVSWNIMVSGYGNHGQVRDALLIFDRMEENGTKPNEITFLAILSACAHGGLLEEGRNYFNKMINEYALSPNCKHYASMVDILGRSGNLIEAEAMILNMNIPPDGGVWGALLGACKMHNDIERGERAAEMASKLDPNNDGYYVLLANLYGDAKRWDDVEKVWEMMKNKGMMKQPGVSAT